MESGTARDYISIFLGEKKEWRPSRPGEIVGPRGIANEGRKEDLAWTGIGYDQKAASSEISRDFGRVRGK